MAADVRGRAAVADGRGALLIKDILVEPPGPGEVTVELRASGVCHTDLDGLQDVDSPTVLGHEGAGVVTAVGSGVRSVAIGDRVILTWAIACGSCFQCLRGNQVLCEVLGPEKGGARARSSSTFDDGALARYFALGTMSTHTVVRAEAVVRIPTFLPFTSACLLGCAVMTGYGSVVNAARVTAGSTVVVLGCGGVGLNVVQGARIAGARRIVVVDVDPARFDLADRLGATDRVLARPTDAGLLEAAASSTALLDGRAADFAFECTARPELCAAPLAFIHHGGTAVQVSGVEQTVAIDMGLFEWDKTYITPLYGRCRPAIDFPILFDHYRSGALILDELVTRTYRLEAVHQAFEDVRTGRTLKGVILLG